MPDRLLVDLAADDQAGVLWSPAGGMPEVVSRVPVAWPLDGEALEDLRWYLEDYLRAPFGVWEDRGPAIQARLAGWGELVHGSVFGSGPARDAYQRARDRGLEVVFRSADPALLSLPWELMRDSAGAVALGAGGISRSLPVAGKAGTLAVPGGRLRVLMVISRPAGTADVGYQMVARPLLQRLDAVRGEVDLTVLRPPTFDALREALRTAAEAGKPFQMVHFDGHGAMPSGGLAGVRPVLMAGPGDGVLAFERSGGGPDYVAASRVAGVLAAGGVPVVVLNACQSGAVGKDLEASVATALLNAGCAAVVAMAYSVYAVAAAEFMASFYESLLTGATVGQAVTAGRKRLAGHDGRPSPKGDMPLADWLVPVHYLRADVAFPQARTDRPASAPSLDVALDQIRGAPESQTGTDPFAAVDGLFVGRDDLLYQLDTAARLQRVAVLTGPGGTGKTELAKGFARWWRDTGGVSDPRLVFWHPFEPGLASFGLDGVITRVGLGVFGPEFALLEQPQRLDRVKALLAQMRVLLVWDNFETVREMPDADGATQPLDPDGQADLRGFLDWVRDQSASAVIITSRAREDWLGPVRRITAGGLNRTEAAQYADHLLAPYPAAQSRRERRPFGELLDCLDGHPLAMRLTLPRLDTTDPRDLLAGLQGTTPLKPDDEEGVTGRLASLGACITYSFTHLAEATRRLLPAVSLFRAVADEDVLVLFSAADGVPARFAGTSPEEWKAVLDDAAQTGLLTRLGAGMYQIHPALPGYLAAGWHAENPAGYPAERDACEAALRTACAAFSRWLTGQIESGNAGLALTAIGLQRPTLGAMLGHALDHHSWSDGEGIIRALDAYWDARGFTAEARAWADRVLEATLGPGRDTPAAAGPAADLWLYTILRQAGREEDAGRPDHAVEAHRQALAYLQDQPATASIRTDIAGIYHELGITAQRRGRLDEAEDWYRKALAIFEESGARIQMAGSFHQLGRIAYERGRLEGAEDWYRKSLNILEELGGQSRIAPCYHELGNIAQRRGRLDEAEDWYRKALTIFEELGDRPRMAGSYHQLGTTAQTQGRLDEADDWYRQALATFEEFGDRPRIADCYLQLGITAWYRGRLDEADEWCRRALAISDQLADSARMKRSYHQLGMTAGDRGRLDEAEDWFRKALTISMDLGDGHGTATSYHQLGITAQRRGRLDEAEDWYRKSLVLTTQFGERPVMAMTLAQLGLLSEERGLLLTALEYNIQSASLFDQFPSSLTGTSPAALARLTGQLGMPALEDAWHQVVGRPLPQAVRDYVTCHQEAS